ncbi:MAG: DUF3352 domain-containing protein [Chlamydiae bacterium]|nr:DUF3352 domain-containing protein [Chlamydiota bacterium]MBI3266987.1 DUF3352 domain-containing protein [Chlamydiota bacterium]
MKKGILGIVIVAVVAVGAFVALKVVKSRTAGVEGPSGVERPVTEALSSYSGVAIADVVPSDVVVFLSARNTRSTWDLIKNSNFWQQASSLKIWESAQLGMGLKNFKDQFKTNMGFDLTEENVLGLFGQDLSIALLGSKEGLANPQLLLMAKTDPKVDIQGKMSALVEKVKPTVTVEEVEYNGQKISRLRNPNVPGPEFNYAIIGDIFALTIGVDDTGIRKVADLVSKKSMEALGSSTQYKDAVGALKIRGDLRGIIFVNMSKIVDLIKAMPAPEGTPKGFTEGLEQTLGTIKSVAAAVGFDRGMLVKLFFVKNQEVAAASPQGQLLTGWDSLPKETQSLKYLPEDSLLLTVSNSIDFMKIWDVWQKNLETQNADQAKAILDGLASFEKDSGVQIKQDILSWLDDEVCFSITNVDMSGLFPFPHLVFLAKVKDGGKALEGMQKIADYAVHKSAPEGVSAPAGQTAGLSENTEGDTALLSSPQPTPSPSLLGQIKVSEEEYNGVNIHFLEVQLPYQTLNPSYALVNNFLVIGINKDSVKHVIDVSKGTSKAVTEDSAFRSTTADFSPKVNQVAFLNMEKTLQVVIDITNWANNLQKGRGEAGAQTDQIIQENVIPFLESLRVFKSIAVEAVNENHGIKETMYVQMEDLKKK